MAVFVTADLHFNHEGIIRLERTQFNSVEEHNEYIITRWNETVSKDDIVYILGDLGFLPLDALGKVVKRLNGHKYLIVGNHDKFKEPKAFQDLGLDKIIVGPYFYRPNIILSHEPAKEAYNNEFAINVHGHLHNAVLNAPNYFNVNIHLTDYKPVNIETFIKRADKLCISRRQKFGTEWYKDLYVFNGK